MKSDRIGQWVVAAALTLFAWVLLSHLVVVPALARLLEDRLDSGYVTLGPLTFAYGGTFVAYAGWFTFGLLALVLVACEAWRVAKAPTPRALRIAVHAVAVVAMALLAMVMPGRTSRSSDADDISAVVGADFTSGAVLGGLTLFGLAAIFGLFAWWSTEKAPTRGRELGYVLALVAVVVGSLLVVPLL